MQEHIVLPGKTKIQSVSHLLANATREIEHIRTNKQGESTEQLLARIKKQRELLATTDQQLAAMSEQMERAENVIAQHAIKKGVTFEGLTTTQPRP